MTVTTPIDGTREAIPVREIVVRLTWLHQMNATLTPAEVMEGAALGYLLAVVKSTSGTMAKGAASGTFVLDGKVNAFTKGNRKLKVRARGTLFNAVYFLVA